MVSAIVNSGLLHFTTICSFSTSSLYKWYAMFVYLPCFWNSAFYCFLIVTKQKVGLEIVGYSPLFFSLLTSGSASIVHNSSLLKLDLPKTNESQTRSAQSESAIRSLSSSAYVMPYKCLSTFSSKFQCSLPGFAKNIGMFHQLLLQGLLQVFTANDYMYSSTLSIPCMICTLLLRRFWVPTLWLILILLYSCGFACFLACYILV